MPDMERVCHVTTHVHKSDLTICSGVAKLDPAQKGRVGNFCRSLPPTGFFGQRIVLKNSPLTIEIERKFFSPGERTFAFESGFARKTLMQKKRPVSLNGSPVG